jgi:hypothetical protein
VFEFRCLDVIKMDIYKGGLSGGRLRLAAGRGSGGGGSQAVCSPEVLPVSAVLLLSPASSFAMRSAALNVSVLGWALTDSETDLGCLVLWSPFTLKIATPPVGCHVVVGVVVEFSVGAVVEVVAGSRLLFEGVSVTRTSWPVRHDAR